MPNSKSMDHLLVSWSVLSNFCLRINSSIFLANNKCFVPFLCASFSTVIKILAFKHYFRCTVDKVDSYKTSLPLKFSSSHLSFTYPIRPKQKNQNFNSVLFYNFQNYGENWWRYDPLLRGWGSISAGGLGVAHVTWWPPQSEFSKWRWRSQRSHATELRLRRYPYRATEQSGLYQRFATFAPKSRSRDPRARCHGGVSADHSFHERCNIIKKGQFNYE